MSDERRPEASHGPTATVDANWLAGWLEAIHKQQLEQSRQLKNISTAASFFIVLSVLGMVGTIITTCSTY